MDVLTYDTYSEARSHFKELLDAAESGRPALVQREGATTAVVDAVRLRGFLALGLTSRAELLAEGDGWSVFIPGVPVAADGASVDEALDEMVDALRDYAADWQDHLRSAPNHRANWALVQLVSLSADDELRAWLVDATA